MSLFNYRLLRRKRGPQSVCTRGRTGAARCGGKATRRSPSRAKPDGIESSGSLHPGPFQGRWALWSRWFLTLLARLVVGGLFLVAGISKVFAGYPVSVSRILVY